jgi:hypothetical protein
MMGFLTVVVLICAAGAAVLVARSAEIVGALARHRLASRGAHEREGAERSASVTSLVRAGGHALRVEVDRSRLADGGWLGGRYIVWFRAAEWHVIAGRVENVKEAIQDRLCTETGLAPGELSIVLKCDPRATVAVRAAEVHLPPRTTSASSPEHERVEPVAAAAEPVTTLVLVDLGDRLVARLPDNTAVYVGRSPACDVTLGDAKVSEHHFEIRSRSDAAEVRDLGSRNGVWVMGVRIEGAVWLRPGETVRAGDTTLRLVDATKAIVAVPEAAEPVEVAVAREPVGAESSAAGLPTAELKATPLLPAAAAAAPVRYPERIASHVRSIRTAPMALEDLPRRLPTRSDPVVLGWDRGGAPVMFEALTDPVEAGNGHLLIYGASGLGKSQLLRAIIPQAISRGIATCVIDQAGDYADLPGMRVGRPWEGMAGNPLCPASDTSAAEARAKIELAEALTTAVASRHSRLGHRQHAKLREALDAAYAEAAAAARWPTLGDLHEQFDADLRGVFGEVTGRGLFTGGGPLGDILAANTVVDVSEIPGTGTLQRLVTGVVLAAIDVRVVALPPAPGSVRYLLVIDEANRVGGFASLDRLLREGRAAGLAVAVSSQRPQDLPDIAHAVAGTTVCLRLGLKAAQVAAGHLDGADTGLAERIARLSPGDAIVKVAGQPPAHVRLAQHHRDAHRLGAPPPVDDSEAAS